MALMFIAAFGALALLLYAILFNSNNRRYLDEGAELEIKMLGEARIMFPTAENDIIVLDLLYAHIYRELLIAKKENRVEWEMLQRKAIAIFNAKNKAINHAVRFEERYILPFTRKERSETHA